MRQSAYASVVALIDQGVPRRLDPPLADYCEAPARGYYIRDGIIVVPKDGVIRPGLVV